MTRLSEPLKAGYLGEKLLAAPSQRPKTGEGLGLARHDDYGAKHCGKAEPSVMDNRPIRDGHHKGVGQELRLPDGRGKG
jgi:hypothetical protein